MKFTHLRILASLLLLTVAMTAFAQRPELLESTQIEVEAPDGLILQADLYLPEEIDTNVPILVTIHMLRGDRSQYLRVMPELINEGYAVLNIDMRGHGGTGGDMNWELARTDMSVWLDWIETQNNIDASRIAFIGGSIGANTALVACGDDVRCATVIALSPGVDYQGVQPVSAMGEPLAERSVLLVAVHDDVPAADGVRELFLNATGDVGVHIYTGGEHGTRMFTNAILKDRLLGTIFAWLDDQFADRS